MEIRESNRKRFGDDYEQRREVIYVGVTQIEKFQQI